VFSPGPLQSVRSRRSRRAYNGARSLGLCRPCIIARKKELGIRVATVTALEVFLSYVIDIGVVSVALHVCQNFRSLFKPRLLLTRLTPTRGHRYVVTKEPLELVLDD